MAIYSLNHKPIGKSTQERPYTTGAHVDYITRPNALGRLDGARMPVETEGAKGFFRDAEDGSRKNGRVSDKLMLALPKELNREQRAELVRGFAEEVTDGRAPWLAAHHDRGKDARNPHCHMLFRDQDPETGRRVFGSSDKGSTQRLRDIWARHANGALERAGRPERIDARSLKAQGIDRDPQIHEGPRGNDADRRGRRPVSKPRNFRNGAGAKAPSRTVDYPQIDNGRTRPEHNRALRSAPRERDYWDAIEEDRRNRELAGLRRIHIPHEGNRAEPSSRSFADKLRAHRQRAEKPNSRPIENIPHPDKIPKVASQPTLPFRDALRKHQALARPGSRPTAIGRSRDDEPER